MVRAPSLGGRGSWGRGSWGWGLCFVAVVTLGACASEPRSVSWGYNYRAAEVAYADGRHEEAIGRFRELVERSRDHSDSLRAWLRLGDSYRSTGRRQRAIDAYVQAYRHSQGNPDRAECGLRIAGIYFDTQQTRSEGGKALLDVVTTYPDTVSALRALDVLSADLGESNGEPEPGAVGPLRELWLALLPQVDGSSVGLHIRYRLAKLANQLQRKDLWTEAIDWLEPIRELDPPVALWDDSMFLSAELYRRLGRFDEALEALSDVLRKRTKPRIFGNYETKFYHRGQWMKIRILIDDVDKPRAAIGALDTFISEFYFSGQYDDALFELGGLWRRLGDETKAAAAWRRLIEDRPESHLVRRAEELLARRPDPGDLPAWSRPHGAKPPSLEAP